ncbi:unnamed protein product [Brassica oleracea var. botrytis]|uniref:Uncharacterized protein n=1 Tax=Brassica napus TaxID=3708 RepID=A0ABQ7XEG9_BRANA|nr:hypothetical protein HID58_093170 [Brassica napus]
MDSDAGSSRRRRRLSSPLLRYSSLFVSFVDFLQVCLLYLGFLSSSFVNGCASSRRCRIQTLWIMFLTCSPPSSIMAALVSDLTCEVCACTALSRFPKNVRRTDLPLSSSSWAMNFLPTGKICSNFPRCERSFRIVIFRGSFVRSTSLVCSELYSSSSAANLTLSEDPKSHRLRWFGLHRQIHHSHALHLQALSETPCPIALLQKSQDLSTLVAHLMMVNL